MMFESPDQAIMTEHTGLIIGEACLIKVESTTDILQPVLDTAAK